MANPVVIQSIAASGLQAREALRADHRVRLVEPAEEGFGVDKLPDGVYGFTYSPAIAAPLFTTFRYRTYEMHRLRGGDAVIVGFASPADAERLASARDEVEVTLVHDAIGEAVAIVAVPYSRIVHHRQIATPNQVALHLHVRPA